MKKNAIGYFKIIGFIAILFVQLVALSTAKAQFASTPDDNKSLLMNGANQYVLIPYKPAFDFTEGTFETWIKPDWAPNFPVNPCIAAIRESSARTRWSLHMEKDLSRIGLWNGSSYNTVPYPFQRNQWYHVAFVFKPNNTEIFVNGVSIGETNNAINRNIRNVDLKIGASEMNTGAITALEYITGRIDEVRFWSTQRTAAQIRENYNREIDPNSTGLTMYYPIGENVISEANQLTRKLDDETANVYIGKLINFWPPVLETTTATDFTSQSARMGGQILSEEEAGTERGIVWATSPSPTVADRKIQIGRGLGAFNQVISGLPSNANIYYRTYAINTVGVGYGPTKQLFLPTLPFTSTPVLTVPYDTPYKYDITTAPSPGFPTTVSATQLPSWLTLNASGSSASTASPIGNVPAGTVLSATAEDEAGNVYVIRTNGTELFKISVDGTTSSWKKDLFGGTPAFGSVNSLAISNGYIYIPRSSSSHTLTRIPLNNPSAIEEIFLARIGGIHGLKAKDGFLYATTGSRELLKINELTRSVEVLVNGSQFSTNDILSGLDIDSRGNIYMATRNLHILKYDGTTVSEILNDLPARTTSVKVDQSDNLFISMWSGGVRKYNASFSEYTLVSGANNDNVHSLFLSSSGSLTYTKNNTNEVYQLKSTTSYSLTGTPSKKHLGPHQVTLHGNNGISTATQSFTVTVTDETAPIVENLSPETDDTEVSLRPTLSMTFDEEVELGIKEASINLLHEGAIIQTYTVTEPGDRALFTRSPDQKTLTFTLTEDLPENATITVAVEEGFVKDLHENDFAGITATSAAWKFTTRSGAIAVNSVSVPNNATYGIGQYLDFTVNYAQAVTINTTNGTPFIPITIGDQTVRASYYSGSGGNAIVFQYTVTEGDLDTDGIAVGTDIALNGGDMGVASTALTNIPSTVAIFVDGIRPTAEIVMDQTSLKIGETATVIITFSEPVTGFTNADLSVSNGSLSQVASSDGGITWTATLTPVANLESTNNLITLYLTSVSDGAGNAGTGTAVSDNYVIDTKAPATPTNLQATFGNTENTLSWTANTESDLASYRIYGGTTINPATLLTTVNAPSTSYVHTELINGTTYYYRIAAVDQVGNMSEVSTDIKTTPKAPQVITFNPIAPKTYGDADFAPGATSDNTATAITYISSDEDVAIIVNGNIQIVGVGSTTITASQSATAAFIAAVDQEQTLEVIPATLTVTANAGQQKVYGQNDPVFTYTVTGYQNQEDETILSGALTRDAGEDVGSYKLRLGDLTAGDNYNVNFFGNDFEITPADIMDVTFANNSFVYDRTGKSISIDGNLPTNTTVSYTINGESGNTATNAGTYTVVATLSGSNYTTITKSANLTINKAQPVVTAAQQQTHVYDGNTKTVEAAVAPTELADQLQYSPSASYTNVGNHEVRVYLHESANYLAAETTIHFAITPATQQGLELPNLTVSYDGEEHELKVIGATSDATITYTIDDAAGNSAIEAGSYSVHAVVRRPNYTDVTLKGTLYINKAAATITSETLQQHTYDGTAKSVVASLNHGETALTFSAQSYNSAGTYTVIIRAAETANYHAASREITLQISPATQEGLIMGNRTVTYDGQPHGLFVTGAATDATISYTIDGVAGNTATSAGIYHVQAVVSRPNYAEEKVEGTLTINRATAYIHGDEKQANEYDGTIKTLSTSLSHSESSLVFNSPTSYTNVGTYVIEATAPQSTNYEAVRKTFTLRIDPTNVVGVEMPDGNFVYDGTVHQLAITGNLPQGTVVAYTNNSRTLAGTQEVVATITGSNYRTLVKSATLTITPAELRITATPLAKLFGAADPELTYTVTGIITGDRADAVITGAPTRQSGEAEGDYSITRGTLQVVSNYSLTFTESILSIHSGIELAADQVVNNVKADESLYIPVNLRNLWETTYPAGATLKLHVNSGQGVEIKQIHSADFDIRKQGDDWIITTIRPWSPASSKALEIEIRGDATFAGTSDLTVSVWSPSNVSSQADQVVHLDLAVEEGYFEIITPNVFTPNGDGVNETFLFKGLELHDRAEFTVLNRFGDQVYKNLDYKNDWTAPNVEDGTYFYILEVYRYSEIQRRTVKSFFRGSVLIKRK